LFHFNDGHSPVFNDAAKQSRLQGGKAAQAAFQQRAQPRLQRFSTSRISGVFNEWRKPRF